MSSMFRHALIAALLGTGLLANAPEVGGVNVALQIEVRSSLLPLNAGDSSTLEDQERVAGRQRLIGRRARSWAQRSRSWAFKGRLYR